MKTDPSETVEALFQSQGRDRHGIYWIVLGGTIAAFLAIFFVKADITVMARGAIRPELERVQIVAPIDGHIIELNVVENMTVKEGQLLLRLKSDFIDEQVRFNERDHKENADSISDLEYLLQCIGENREVDLARLKIQAYRADWEYYQSRLSRAKIENEKTHSTLARAKQLHNRGVMTDQDLEETNYAAVSAEAAILNITRESISRWESDLRTRVEKLAALASERKHYENEQSLRQVEAPVAGTALGFVGFSRGQYVRAGTRLGDISPTGNTHVEVFVPAKDIGFIYPGQPVRVQVDSFPHSRWGTLRGRVTNVSADREATLAEAAFKVVVLVSDNKLSAGNGTVVEAVKGMNVSAGFVVTRLTLFEMIIQSMSHWVNPYDAHRDGESR